MTDLFDLTGKVALVTGGSRGLGRAMVRAFAEHGADVIIASRKLDGCEALATEVEGTFGRRAYPIACNVSDWDQCDALADAAYQFAGRVDILVNNAGMSPTYPSLDQVSEALFDKVMGVNVKGPFRLSAVIGSRMAQGDGGSIINVSSVAAIRPREIVVPYSAAKAGLEAITVGFADALAPNVRVNAIRCGIFRTDINKNWPAEMFDAASKEMAFLGRGGEPTEVVGAALYLASAASSYCTGTILSVDGGVR